MAKSHTKENAHELFAVVVDVDYVGKQQLKNLLKQFGNGVQLRPTYLVSSGKGYIFIISCRSRFSCIETGKKCLRS